MKPFKVMHIGDCHLGYRQYGFNVREDDIEAAVTKVADLAIKLEVDVMLWPGDVYDSPNPSSRSVFFMYQTVHRLKAKGVESIGIDGNHDAADGRWMYVCGMRTFAAGPPYTIKERVIEGLNYMRPAETAKALERMANHAYNRIDILMLHQPLGDMVPFGCEITAESLVKQFKPYGLKYVALGDIHNFQIRAEDGVTLLYPGSVEMTDIDEQPDKKCVVLEFDADNKLSINYYEIPTRKVVRYSIKTEEDLNHLLQDVQKGNTLPVVTVDTNLVGGVERVQKALGGNIPHRLMRSADETLQQKFADPEWDRKGSIVDLKSAVAQVYPESTVEHQLILDMLSNPKAVAETANKYLQSKGVTA